MGWLNSAAFFSSTDLVVDQGAYTLDLTQLTFDEFQAVAMVNGHARRQIEIGRIFVRVIRYQCDLPDTFGI